MTSLPGTTWEMVDDWTLPRLYAMTAYWKKHPPTHVIAAAFAGYKASEGEDQPVDLSFGEFLALGRQVPRQ